MIDNPFPETPSEAYRSILACSSLLGSLASSSRQLGNDRFAERLEILARDIRIAADVIQKDSIRTAEENMEFSKRISEFLVKATLSGQLAVNTQTPKASS